MIIVILILLSLIFNSFFIKANTLKCEDNQIENCKECGEGEESGSCGICEAGYFPLLENLLCIPCNDPIYGQVGCEGECDGEDYSNNGIAYCQKCKDGYFNLEGICRSCDEESPGCLECNYNKDEDIIDKRFNCTKCLNDIEYKLSDNYRCEKCDIDHCKKCHFSKGENPQPECDECEDGYYINSQKACSYCESRDIDGGGCSICLTEKKYYDCWCYSGYTLNNNSCLECPDNCDTCEFNKETSSINCLRCNTGYALDSTQKCVKCEEGCLYCYLNENNQSKCLVCEYRNILSEENKCLICPENCDKCEYDPVKKNQFV